MELSVLTLKDYLAESGEVSLVINFQITKPFPAYLCYMFFYKNGMSLKKNCGKFYSLKKELKKR